MATITATGTPEKYPFLGEIKIVVTGNEVNIDSVEYSAKINEKWEDDPSISVLFDEDMKKGPSYPLCAEPETMRCALFVLYEWFGEAELCWVGEPQHVKIEGEIEPMENLPGTID